MSKRITVYYVCTDCPGGGLDTIERQNEHIIAAFAKEGEVDPVTTCEICGKEMSLLDPTRATELQKATRERTEVSFREWGLRR